MIYDHKYVRVPSAEYSNPCGMKTTTGSVEHNVSFQDTTTRVVKHNISFLNTKTRSMYPVSCTNQIKAHY